MSIEMAILAPFVGVLLVVPVAVGRVQVARADLHGAARSAARDLSLSRDPEAAISDIRAGLEATLDVGSPTCRELTFEPRISATEVAVVLTCTVDVDGSALLPLPGTLSISATATEALDTHRETRP